MEGPGQLPDPQFLVVQYVAADLLVIPAATALTAEPNTAWSDMENVLKKTRTTFEISIANKLYGPFSLTMCQATGGTTGAGYGYGTASSGTSAALANNGAIATGGFPFCGALVIPPKLGFSLTLRFGANVTLAATMLIRMSLVGQLYRKVQ